MSKYAGHLLTKDRMLTGLHHDSDNTVDRSTEANQLSNFNYISEEWYRNEGLLPVIHLSCIWCLSKWHEPRRQTSFVGVIRIA
jgi:hypothetical protein